MKYEEAKKEFVKTISYLGRKHQTWVVFSDFCYMSAISIRQPFEKDAELEKEYLKTIKKYTKEEVEIFPKLLSYVVFALTDRFGDFMGEAFMELELGNKYKGQFFTPYSISVFMAKIVGERGKEIELVSDPACGAGGMIIGKAQMMLESGKNYQRKMIAQAVDIDSLCVYMCYIQLSLLYVQAEVIHGNSLSLEIWDVWRTPAFYLEKSYMHLNEIGKKEVPALDTQIYSQDQINTFRQGKLF